MFVDSTALRLRAGKGGNGVVAWRREKYIPKGGPSGGDGGNGGSVFIQTDAHTHSLEAFRNRKLLYAENGQCGASSLKKGRAGNALILKVPCGTLIKNAQTKEVLFDLTKEDEKVLLCKGGKGGKGNHHFKSPTNQAPNICTPGTLGEELEVELELKLIADIGIIGMPNAGKSTLLSTLTPVRVKIGAYPFTTLFPNLGYLYFKGGSRLLLADIPGLIKNAHKNKGLGFAFLRHIERSSALLFVVDIAGTEGRKPFEDFLTLQEELKAYDPKLLNRPFLIALNKVDLEEAQEHLDPFYSHYPKERLISISARENQGLEALKEALLTLPQ